MEIPNIFYALTWKAHLKYKQTFYSFLESLFHEKPILIMLTPTLPP